MKQLFFTLCFLVPLFAGAQSILLSPSDTIEVAYVFGSYPSEYIYVQNTGSTAVTYNFELLLNTASANGWDVTACTNLGCFPDVPSTGTLGTIAAGDQGFINVHVGFNKIAGTGAVVFRVFEGGHPNNADTLTFIFHGLAPTATTEAQEQLKLAVYPNPASDYLNLNLQRVEGAGDVQVYIYDATGERVYANPFSGASIDVSYLAGGLYVLYVVSDDRTYFARFFKQ